MRADVALSPDNRSKGFGTVLFANRDDAFRAIDTYNQFVWQGRILDVRLDQQDPQGAVSVSMTQASSQGSGPHSHHAVNIPGGGWETGPTPMGNGINPSTGPATVLSTSPSNGDPRSRPTSSAGLEDTRSIRDETLGPRSNPLLINESQNLSTTHAPKPNTNSHSHGPQMFGGQPLGLVPMPFLGNGPNGPMFAVPAYYPQMPGGMMGYYNQGSVSFIQSSGLTCCSNVILEFSVTIVVYPPRSPIVTCLLEM